MKDNGVIEEVTEPTEWMSPIVPVLKPSGDVRICVDLKKLNQSVEREGYVIPTVDEIWFLADTAGFRNSQVDDVHHSFREVLHEAS